MSSTASASGRDGDEPGAKPNWSKLLIRELSYAPQAGPQRETMRDELQRFLALAGERHAPDCFRIPPVNAALRR
jgi:hypothetical protein